MLIPFASVRNNILEAMYARRVDHGHDHSFSLDDTKYIFDHYDDEDRVAYEVFRMAGDGLIEIYYNEMDEPFLLSAV